MNKESTIKYIEDIFKLSCNKLVNGRCDTLACYKRGGYIRGVHKPSDIITTCKDLEAILYLKEKGIIN